MASVNFHPKNIDHLPQAERDLILTAVALYPILNDTPKKVEVYKLVLRFGHRGFFNVKVGAALTKLAELDIIICEKDGCYKRGSKSELFYSGREDIVLNGYKISAKSELDLSKIDVILKEIVYLSSAELTVAAYVHYFFGDKEILSVEEIVKTIAEETIYFAKDIKIFLEQLIQKNVFTCVDNNLTFGIHMVGLDKKAGFKIMSHKTVVSGQEIDLRDFRWKVNPVRAIPVANKICTKILIQIWKKLKSKGFRYINPEQFTTKYKISKENFILLLEKMDESGLIIYDDGTAARGHGKFKPKIDSIPDLKAFSFDGVRLVNGEIMDLRKLIG